MKNKKKNYANIDPPRSIYFRDKRAIIESVTEFIITFFYVVVVVVSFFLDTSTTKTKTFDPVWNEVFIHEVRNAKNLGLTVFHDAAIPPDDFVANCTIPFEDMVHRDEDHQDFWVSFFFFVSTTLQPDLPPI